MATYNPPKKNAAFIMYVGLRDQADANLMKANPTLASGDFKVSKDGGSLANLATLPTVTPASGKMVKISLSATEMNADNVTIVCSDAAGAEWADLIINLQTVANQFDDLDATIDALNNPTAAAIADAVLDEALSGHSTAGTLGKAVADIETDVTSILADTNELQGNQGNWLTATGFSTHAAADIWAVATRTLTAGTKDSEIDSILADTGELQTNQGNWLTATGFSTHSAADIWAVVTRTLTAGTKDTEIDAILADTAELQTNQGNWLTATGFSTHAAADVQALLNDLDASETAAAVWDALLASYQDVGSTGEALGDAGGAGTPPTVTEIRQEMDSNSTQLAAIVADTNELQTNQGNWLTATGFSTHSAADVWTAGVRTLTAGTKDSEIDSILADTAELQANQGNWLTATGFSTHAAADVWAAATRTLTAGTKDSEIDSILADTAELQANQGNWLTATGFSTHSAADVWVAAVRTLTSGAPTVTEIRQEMDSNSTQLAAIVADTNELQQDNVPGLVAALENLSATEVRAQIVSALSVDTYAEPTAKPAATASITDKLAWLTALARNKVTQSDTTQTLYKDDAVSTISTAPVSQSDGVVTRGEFT